MVANTFLWFSYTFRLLESMLGANSNVTGVVNWSYLNTSFFLHHCKKQQNCFASVFLLCRVDFFYFSCIHFVYFIFWNLDLRIIHGNVGCTSEKMHVILVGSWSSYRGSSMVLVYLLNTFLILFPIRF